MEDFLFLRPICSRLLHLFVVFFFHPTLSPLLPLLLFLFWSFFLVISYWSCSVYNSFLIFCLAFGCRLDFYLLFTVFLASVALRIPQTTAATPATTDPFVLPPPNYLINQHIYAPRAICTILFHKCFAMACTASSMTIESYPEHAASTSTTLSEDTALLRDRRRRHSFHTARKLSFDYDADAVFLKVGCLFSLLVWYILNRH